MNDEQWKEGGLCSKCRRQNYCKTECTKHKRRVEAEVTNFVYNKLDEKSGGLFSAIMNSSPYGH